MYTNSSLSVSSRSLFLCRNHNQSQICIHHILINTWKFTERPLKSTDRFDVSLAIFFMMVAVNGVARWLSPLTLNMSKEEGVQQRVIK